MFGCVRPPPAADFFVFFIVQVFLTPPPPKIINYFRCSPIIGREVIIGGSGLWDLGLWVMRGYGVRVYGGRIRRLLSVRPFGHLRLDQLNSDQMASH